MCLKSQCRKKIERYLLTHRGGGREEDREEERRKGGIEKNLKNRHRDKRNQGNKDRTRRWWRHIDTHKGREKLKHAEGKIHGMRTK